MIKVNWNDVRYRSVGETASGGLALGNVEVDINETLDFGAPIGTVSVQDLYYAVKRFGNTAQGDWPQLAFYVFKAVRRPQALNGYFPLLKTLDAAGQKSFYKLARETLLNSGFDARIISVIPTPIAKFETSINVSDDLPEVAYFVAAQIAEIFFHRRDILERLMAAKWGIRLYATEKAFASDGGVAGGCFNNTLDCIQLLLSRLFEGFNAPTPGVAPFLHEFGHVLDYLDAGHGVIGKSSGLLPGMRESDGALYSPEARRLFLQGKQLEMERYNRLYDGATPADPLPIGHPYVFQNDTEFIAGYFEMFLRNPNYFAQQNPDLFQSFVLTFGQDPRRCWSEDFPFYIEQNRGFYLSGKRPAQSGLTIPG
jgi:hypothetical protein